MLQKILMLTTLVENTHPPIPHVQMLEKWLGSVIAILEAGQSWVTSDTEDYIPWDGYIDGGTHMSRRKRGIRLG